MDAKGEAHIPADQPLISVVMATSNRPELALRAVKSVLQQTYANKEVIVINNGSTEENVARYQTLFDGLPIRHVNLNNCLGEGFGPSKARNFGIGLARGGYVAFCDDDDEWVDEGYLSAVAEIIQKTKADVIFADQETEFCDGKENKDSWFRPELVNQFAQPLGEASCYEIDLNYFYTHGGFPHLNASVYALSHLSIYGGFYELITYEEDCELFHRLSVNADRVIYYNKVVSKHYAPDRSKKDNVSTKTDDLDVQLMRATLFNRLMTTSDRNEFLTFVRRHCRYALTRAAIVLIERDKVRSALVLIRQALGCEFKASLIVLYLRALTRGLSRTQPKSKLPEQGEQP